MATTRTLRDVRTETVLAHVSAENNHDVAGTLRTFHHPQYNVVPFAAISDGAQAVSDLLGSLFAGFPDFHVDVESMRHADDAVIAEVRMTGTHQNLWAGIPATGRRIDVPSACIFEFDDDRLLCEKVYFDFATLLRQLGVIQ